METLYREAGKEQVGDHSSSIAPFRCSIVYLLRCARSSAQHRARISARELSLAPGSAGVPPAPCTHFTRQRLAKRRGGERQGCGEDQRVRQAHAARLRGTGDAPAARPSGTGDLPVSGSARSERARGEEPAASGIIRRSARIRRMHPLLQAHRVCWAARERSLQPFQFYF
jgi:hypothetical protein